MNPDVQFGHYRDAAIRALLSAAVLLVVQLHDRALAILLVIVVIAIDARHPFSLKNFFLIYSALLFGVGDGVMHLAEVNVMNDAIAFLLTFLAGYGLSGVRGGAIGGAGPQSRRQRDRSLGVARLRISSIERAMVTLTVVSLVLLALQFRRYGVIGYYQGQQLIDQFTTFGVASAAGGVQQILRFGLTYSSIAFVVLYSHYCLVTSQPIRYRYPVGLLIAMPILFLHRFDAVIGAATALAIYACERRVNATAPSTKQRAAPTEGPPRSRKRSKLQGQIVALSVVAAFGAGILIGGLRSGVGAGGSAAPAISTTGILTAELTPIQAYSDIKVYSDMLGRPLGTTIVFPLLLKVIPRAWFPDKPLNSGGYYMSVVHPATFAANFALPPTFFGDAVLSFGFVGALLLCFLLGAICARLDRGYTDVVVSRIPWFLITFANFYGLMRFPISESLAGIILTLVVWRMSTKFFGLRGERKKAPQAVPLATFARR